MRAVEGRSPSPIWSKGADLVEVQKSRCAQSILYAHLRSMSLMARYDYLFDQIGKNITPYLKFFD